MPLFIKGILIGISSVKTSARQTVSVFMKRKKNANAALSREEDTETVSIDELLLLKAINQGVDQRLETIAELRARNPEWTTEVIEQRMEELARRQLPDWYGNDFWTSEMDRILLAGVRGGLEGERKAVQKILAMCPDLRLETIQQRQRVLARRLQHGKTHRGRKYEWTERLDAQLQNAYEKSGGEAAVTEVERVTGWPRAAIYRHCHKLGISKQREQKQRRWSAVDWKYTSDRLNHVPVSSIAKALHRTVKSVRRKVEAEGYKVRLEDDYTVSRLARELHVRPQRVRQWIQEGKLKRGRNQRIKESVLCQFLKEYGHLFDPAAVEPDMRLLLIECRSAEEDALSAAAS